MWRLLAAVSRRSSTESSSCSGACAAVDFLGRSGDASAHCLTIQHSSPMGQSWRCCSAKVDTPRTGSGGGVGTSLRRLSLAVLTAYKSQERIRVLRPASNFSSTPPYIASICSLSRSTFSESSGQALPLGLLVVTFLLCAIFLELGGDWANISLKMSCGKKLRSESSMLLPMCFFSLFSHSPPPTSSSILALHSALALNLSSPLKSTPL
mmetsp:Transcript_50717/g.81972  ORF Transcript_50717/g.81972 Transcript_50717/m.81972 type:complete len:209 (-) Transcript_50717:7-633(-)